jgi:hypothetical protein
VGGAGRAGVNAPCRSPDGIAAHWQPTAEV